MIAVKHMRFCFFVLEVVLIVVSVHPISAQNPDNLVQTTVPKSNAEGKSGSVPEDEYVRAREVLDKFRQNKDLAGLEKLADDIYTRWYERDEQRYFVWILAMCDVLASYDFGDNRRFELMQKYATQALQKSKRMPIGIEAGLVIRLSRDEEYLRGKIKNEEWAKIRTKKIKIWLHPLQRLEKEIDRNFDPKDRRNYPELKVMPPKAPPGQMVIAGMDPAGIRDPESRALYEAVIAANHQKAVKLNRQLELRGIEENFIKKAERYIVAMYSRPPYNLAELKENLNEFISDAVLKDRIIKSVTEATTPQATKK